MHVLTQRETFAYRMGAPQPHLMLPTELIRQHYAAPGMGMTPMDQGYRDDLAQDVGKNGVKTPLQIYTDGEHGVLGDGYHRLQAAEAAGVSHLPIFVVRHNRLTEPWSTHAKPLDPAVKGWLGGGS